MAATQRAEITGADFFVTLNGLQAHYVEWGDPQAPPIVLLHGLRSYARTWEPVVAALSDRYRLIALDHRGRGESDWDPAGEYFTGSYVSDLEQFADTLGLTRFALVGHSMGGATALVYAGRHPERVRLLVVEDVGPGSSGATAGAQRVRRELAETPRGFATLAAARAYWRNVRPGISEEALRSRVQHTLREDRSGRWVWKFDLDGIARARLNPDPAHQIDLWPSVGALRCPALVLRGAQTDFLPISTCEEMAARQPLLSWAEIPAAGHYVHDDNLGDYLTALTSFLGQHSGDV
jgi:pimeloyl-ACP methyl ester carboxylesterase